MTEQSEDFVLLQARMPKSDKRLIEETAKLYGLDVKQFVPLAARLVAQTLPKLELSPAGKGFAPTLSVN